MSGVFPAFLIIVFWFSALFLGFSRVQLEAPVDYLIYLWLFFIVDFLFVGLFIIGHDACHGTVAQKSYRLNLWIGRIAAFLYAGFIFDKLNSEHRAHHKNSGLTTDPDFHGPRAGDANFLLWLLKFGRHYFSVFQIFYLPALGNVFMHVFKIPDANVFYFWVAPSLLSALQLFYFGTFLPHRNNPKEPSPDNFNARDTKLSWLWSLLTCYHFGAYHRTHHEKPNLPWFSLPFASTRG